MNKTIKNFLSIIIILCFSIYTDITIPQTTKQQTAKTSKKKAAATPQAKQSATPKPVTTTPKPTQTTETQEEAKKEAEEKKEETEKEEAAKAKETEAEKEAESKEPEKSEEIKQPKPKLIDNAKVIVFNNIIKQNITNIFQNFYAYLQKKTAPPDTSADTSAQPAADDSGAAAPADGSAAPSDGSTPATGADTGQAAADTSSATPAAGTTDTSAAQAPATGTADTSGQTAADTSSATPAAGTGDTSTAQAQATDTSAAPASGTTDTSGQTAATDSSAAGTTDSSAQPADTSAPADTSGAATDTSAAAPGAADVPGLTINIPIIGSTTLFPIQDSQGNSVLQAKINRTISIPDVPVSFSNFQITITQDYRTNASAEATVFGKKAKLEIVQLLVDQNTDYLSQAQQVQSKKTKGHTKLPIILADIRLTFIDKPTIHVFPDRPLQLDFIELMLNKSKLPIDLSTGMTIDKYTPISSSAVAGPGSSVMGTPTSSTSTSSSGASTGPIAKPGNTMITEANFFGQDAYIAFSFSKQEVNLTFGLASTKLGNIVPELKTSDYAKTVVKKLAITTTHGLTQKQELDAKGVTVTFAGEADFSAVTAPPADADPSTVPKLNLGDVKFSAKASSELGLHLEGSMAAFTLPILGTINNAAFTFDSATAVAAIESGKLTSKQRHRRKRKQKKTGKAPVYKPEFSISGDGSFTISRYNIGTINYTLSAYRTNKGLNFQGDLNHAINYGGIKFEDASFNLDTTNKTLTISSDVNIKGFDLTVNLNLSQEILEPTAKKQTKGPLKKDLTLTAEVKNPTFKPFEKTSFPSYIKDIVLSDLKASFVKNETTDTEEISIGGNSNILKMPIYGVMKFIEKKGDKGIFFKAYVADDQGQIGGSYTTPTGTGMFGATSTTSTSISQGTTGVFGSSSAGTATAAPTDPNAPAASTTNDDGTPKVTLYGFGKFKFKSASFLITTINYTDPDSNIDLKPGLSLQAELPLTGPLAPLGKLVGKTGESLNLYGTFGPALKDIKLGANLTDGTLPSNTKKVLVGPVQVEVSGGPEFTLIFNISVQPSSYDHALIFKGLTKYSTVDSEVDIEAQMDGMWDNPFGIKGLAIGNLDLGLKINLVEFPETHLPSGFQLAGELDLAKDKIIKIALAIDIPEFQNVALLGSFAGTLTLADIVTYIAAKLGAKIPVNKIPEIDIKDIELKMAPQTTQIGAITVTQGLTVKGEIDLFNEKAAVDFNIDTGGVKALADMSKITLGPLVISAGKEADGKIRQTKFGGPEIDIELTMSAQKFLVSGLLTIADIFSESADVSISKNGIEFAFEASIGPDNAFDAMVTGKSSGKVTNPDFRLIIDMKQKFTEYVKEKAVAALNKAEDEIKEKIEAAKKKVDSLNDQMARDQKAIDDAEKAVNSAKDKVDSINSAIATSDKKIDEATQKVKSAQSAVDSINGKIKEAQGSIDGAQKKVNSIQSEIDHKKKVISDLKSEISHAAWYKAAYYAVKDGAQITAIGVELGGLYTALGVATGALQTGKAVATGALIASRETATGALKVAQGFLQEVVKNVGRDTLIASRETAKAALTVANLFLDKVVKNIDKGALIAARDSAKGILTAAETSGVGVMEAGKFVVKSLTEGFMINEIKFDGSLKNIENGQLPDMLFVFHILGKEERLNLDIDFKNIGKSIVKFTDNLVDKVKKSLKI